MHPDKAVGWNKMPFGRDTGVIQSNTVLDRGPSLHGRGDWGLKPPVCSIVAYHQITLAVVCLCTVSMVCVLTAVYFQCQNLGVVYKFVKS